MPGQVLCRREIVERVAGGYRLAADLGSISPHDVDSLIALCDEAVARFKAARGAAIWEHRAIGLGTVPGKLRYEVLTHAGFRCELCGVSANERALDVDHIVPRKAGGLDAPEKLQALCWLCNTNKGAGDDAGLRRLAGIHSYRDEGCPFCEMPRDRVVAENALAYAIRDDFPVTPLHTLVIPKRHVRSHFDLFSSEERAVQRLLRDARLALQSEDSSVRAFNVGINDGEAAGHTVIHCHVHLIPRRHGDTAHPRGGVRGVIPGKANY